MMRSREMMMRSASVGEGMMITSQEYRRMAEECFGWAREAQTDEVRLCYVNLAKTWLQRHPGWKMFPIVTRGLL